MAFKVELTHFPRTSLGPDDLRLDIRHNGEKLGVLQISKGRVDWFSAHKSSRVRRLNWHQFAKVMNDHGKKAHATKRH
jgi:hypothetical protein